MNKLEELIKEFCPNGVEYKKLGDICIVETGGEPPKNSVKGKHPAGEYIYPIFSNGVGENALWGFSDSYRINIPAVTFSSIGTIGCPTLRETAFTPIIRLKVLYPKNNTELDVKFLKYALETVEFKQQKSSVPNINANMIKSIIIPLPALPVQREIVRILDSFTLYSAELTAELTARRKQYEFYRDKLLNFDIEIEWKTIEETCNMSAGGDVPKDRFSREKTEQFYVPVYSNGVDENALYGYTDKAKIFEPCITVAARGTIGYCALRTEPFFPVVRLICLCPKKEIIPKYLKYYIETIHFQVPTSGIPQLTVPMIGKYKIPVPPIEVQERIVKVLDNFDAICSDLGIGLPAEIEKRQKQYEYYREKLLTFDGKYATILTERAGLIRLLQYVYGFAFVRLEDIADYSTNRITAKSVDKNNYVGVDNLLADRQGKTESVYVPENGNLIEFRSENTLIGNIRPYLKKIWFANCNGGTNGDVLVIKANEDYIMPKYLYYVLSSDKFFAFDMQYAKGAKMPRGNRVAIMTYQFSLPTLDKQKEIVAILDKFDNLCNDLTAGLPAEIEKRQKQYEYYRDKLLRF